MKTWISVVLCSVTLLAGVFSGYWLGAQNQLALDLSAQAFMHANVANSKEPQVTALVTAKALYAAAKDFQSSFGLGFARYHPIHYLSLANSADYSKRTEALLESAKRNQTTQ